MKRNIDKNLTNIQNFFHLMCFEQNATREEVFNFLQELIKYVFKINNIKLDDYTINIHFVKEEDKKQKTKKQESKQSIENRLFSDNTNAIMFADNKDPYLFDIYMPMEFSSLKPTKEENHRKKQKTKNKNVVETEQDMLSQKTFERVSNVEDFITFIFNFLHEVAHIVQYVKTPNKMKKYDVAIDEMQRNKDLVELCLENNKDKRILLKTIEKYTSAQGYVAPYELDANEKAHDYFKSIILKTLKTIEDVELEDFLCMTQKFLDDTKMFDIAQAYIFDQFSEEAKQKLKQLKLDDTLFLHASDYVYFTSED